MGRPRKIKDTTKNYFTPEVEDAILEYNKVYTQQEKNTIYKEKIEYAFDKLCENMLNTFQWDYLKDEGYFQLKNSCLSFLIEKLPYYKDPQKGKAFSYFSIVCKNYLIINNNAQYQKLKQQKENTLIGINPDILCTSNDTLTSKIEITNDLSIFMNKFILYMRENLPFICWTTNVSVSKVTILPSVSKNTKVKEHAIEYMQIADALLDIFAMRENLEIFNKKAFYILIKERVNCKASTITTVVKRFKMIFYEMYHTYLSTGQIYLKELQISDFFIR